MKTKVGINGFGRIGRNVLKAALEKDRNFEIVAINGLSSPRTYAHLFKYDSCFGTYAEEVLAKEDAIVVGGREIKTTTERNPENLPWKAFGVDVVIECTGAFTKKEAAEKHITAGAKKVVISSPATDEDVTIVLGVNEDVYDASTHHIISNASCTTNCLAPVTKVIDDEFGIIKGMMTTVHSYTNDQKLLDMTHNDLRRARAAAVSMIPTTTGAAEAVSLVLPHLRGKLNGMSLRVPTAAVSIVDVVFELSKKTTVEELNAILKKAAESDTLKKYLGYCEEPLVSIDFKGDSRSAIVDALSTMVVEDNMVKVLAWYDNEWGYSHRMVDAVEYIVDKGI